jgi:hypothetical protein
MSRICGRKANALPRLRPHIATPKRGQPSTLFGNRPRNGPVGRVHRSRPRFFELNERITLQAQVSAQRFPPRKIRVNSRNSRQNFTVHQHLTPFPLAANFVNPPTLLISFWLGNRPRHDEPACSQSSPDTDGAPSRRPPARILCLTTAHPLVAPVSSRPAIPLCVSASASRRCSHKNSCQTLFSANPFSLPFGCPLFPDLCSSVFICG